MTTDFRALCADLLCELDHASAWDYQQALKDQARAALADEPAVPEGREPASVTTQPSDAELDELAWTWYSKTGSTWYQIEAFRAYARAVLAKWGNSQGILDSSRQPVPEMPTDEELTLTYAYPVAAAVGNKRGQFTTEDIEAAQLAGLRAVLAKWGHQ